MIIFGTDNNIDAMPDTWVKTSKSSYKRDPMRLPRFGVVQSTVRTLTDKHGAEAIQFIATIIADTVPNYDTWVDRVTMVDYVITAIARESMSAQITNCRTLIKDEDTECCEIQPCKWGIKKEIVEHDSRYMGLTNTRCIRNNAFRELHRWSPELFRAFFVDGFDDNGGYGREIDGWATVGAQNIYDEAEMRAQRVHALFDSDLANIQYENGINFLFAHEEDLWEEDLEERRSLENYQDEWCDWEDEPYSGKETTSEDHHSGAHRDAEGHLNFEAFPDEMTDEEYRAFCETEDELSFQEFIDGMTAEEYRAWLNGDSSDDGDESNGAPTQFVNIESLPFE